MTASFLHELQSEEAWRLNLSQQNGSSSMDRGAQQALDRYVTTSLCALGFVGNVLNILVLSRMRLRKTEGCAKESGVEIGLYSLALSDGLFCLALFPRGFLSGTRSTFKTRDFLFYYQAYGTGLVTTFILASTWITVAMAVMRYVAICQPLRSRRLDTPLVAKVTFPLIFTGSIVFNLPTFWQYHVTSLRQDDEVVYLIDLGSMDHTNPHGLAFLWVRAILGTFVPALVLIFCNYSLTTALRQSLRMRKEYHVREPAAGARNRVTTVLIVVAMSFVVLVVPSEILNFLLEVIGTDGTRTEGFLLARSVTNTLQVANFALNFVLYFTLNCHFRAILLELCRCQLSRAGTASTRLRTGSTTKRSIRMIELKTSAKPPGAQV